MKTRFLRVLAVLGVALVVVAGAVRAGRAQTAKPSSDVLEALLTEVRGLRAAMEQMASAGPRIQLALGRLQLQEQRVTTLIQRLDALRTRLANAQREVENHRDQLAQMETALRGSALPEEERMSVEMHLGQVRKLIANANSDVQRFTLEEAAAAQDVVVEQSRWTDINQLLEELERSLARR